MSELQQLTRRVEQVPAQLQGTESIFDVKSALSREIMSVADVMEDGLVAAQDTIDQLQAAFERAEETTADDDELFDDEDGDVSDDAVDGAETEYAGEAEWAGETERVAAFVPAPPVVVPPASRGFFRSKLEDWARRIAPPPAVPPPPAAPLPPPKPAVDPRLVALAAAKAAAVRQANDAVRQANDAEAKTAALRDTLADALSAMSQWLDGQQLMYERLQNVLQSAGVRPIEVEGELFDPARHRAVSVDVRADVPAGIIVAEERKGYLLDGKILRYAEVIVAKNE